VSDSHCGTIIRLLKERFTKIHLDRHFPEFFASKGGHFLRQSDPSDSAHPFAGRPVWHPKDLESDCLYVHEALYEPNDPFVVMGLMEAL
jgi:hypothetical protein